MTISFVGGGIMAESFIAGVLKKGLFVSDEIYVSDPIPERREYLETTYKVNLSLIHI